MDPDLENNPEGERLHRGRILDGGGIDDAVEQFQSAPRIRYRENMGMNQEGLSLKSCSEFSALPSPPLFFMFSAGFACRR